MKVVLDANVVIAAFAAHGLCECVFELCIQQHNTFLCPDLLTEIEERLISKIKMPSAQASEIIEYLIENCTIALPQIIADSECRDPDDTHVLGLAQAVDADFIVTGDKDLLVLHSFQKASIVTPRAFWEAVS